jgi:acetyl esterase/lipase
MGWAFLAVSLVGAWFTINALWPSRRWQLLVLSFFAGWMTAELAYFHLAWQAVATAIFIWAGALDTWPGLVGLAITLVSWAGLTWVIIVSLRSKHVVEAALREGLGDDYRSEIAPGLAQHLANRLVRRQLLLPLWFRDQRVEATHDIPYVEGGGKRQRLDIYRPKIGVERAPVLLQIHGGGWVIGDKGQQGMPLMMHLAAEGWVCVANNYRLSPKVSFPEHLIDCKRALAWVREHIAEYGGNPDFVVVTGGSAGGHLAALVALTHDDPQYQPGFEHVDTSVSACVPFYGVYDLTEVFDFHGPGEQIADWMAKRVMKQAITENRPLYEEGSPINRIRSDAPPFFVIHGTNDNLVPIEQAQRFVAKLRAISTEPVAFANIPGASHAFEVFHGVRTGNAVNGVDRFLAWLYSAHQAEKPEAPADPVHATEGSDDTAAAI